MSIRTTTLILPCGLRFTVPVGRVSDLMGGKSHGVMTSVGNALKLPGNVGSESVVSGDLEYQDGSPEHVFIQRGTIQIHRGEDYITPSGDVGTTYLVHPLVSIEVEIVADYRR